MVAPAGFHLQTDTRNPDEACALIAQSYCPFRLLPARGSGEFHTQHYEAGGHRLSAYSLSYGSGITELDPVPFDRFVLISRPVHGRFSVSVGDRQRVLTPGESVVLDAHTAYHMRFQDDCRLLTFRIDRGELERTVADLRGFSETAPVLFPLQHSPVRTAAAWDQVTRFLLREVLPSDLLTTAPLLREQVIRMVIASMIESYPSVIGTLDRSAGQASPAAVRRAKAFIDEAAAQPIRMSDIAAAARLSPRALQEAFRKYMDTTPMAYLRSVRLRCAHAELQLASGDSSATVAAIAYSWGFANLGRFAADYRRLFGRSPSDVLREDPAPTTT